MSTGCGCCWPTCRCRASTAVVWCWRSMSRRGCEKTHRARPTGCSARLRTGEDGVAVHPGLAVLLRCRPGARRHVVDRDPRRGSPRPGDRCVRAGSRPSPGAGRPPHPRAGASGPRSAPPASPRPKPRRSFHHHAARLRTMAAGIVAVCSQQPGAGRLSVAPGPPARDHATPGAGSGLRHSDGDARTRGQAWRSCLGRRLHQAQRPLPVRLLARRTPRPLRGLRRRRSGLRKVQCARAPAPASTTIPTSRLKARPAARPAARTGREAASGNWS